MTETKTNGDDPERETLTRRANRARSRLLADVDQLEARRHALVDTVDALQENTKKLLPVVAVGAAGAAVVGVAVWAFGRRRRRREALLLPWMHANLATAEPHHVKSPTRKLVENVAGTIALAVLRRVATRAVQHWVAERQPTAAE